MWQQWVNGILGLWIFLSAFLPLEAQVTTWNLTIVGLVIGILGFWGAMQKKGV